MGSESLRLSHKMRALQLERDDLEKAIQGQDVKLQEKDKELAIHYIYAQRLTKPPTRLVSTPPKGPPINRCTMTDEDPVIKRLTDDNLLLQQEVHQLRSKLQEYGETGEFLDQEKARLEQEQLERAEKEKQFRLEMEQARKDAEEEQQKCRVELEKEAEKERREKHEIEEKRRQVEL